MKPKIGIIGHGNVGSALERGLRRVGYDVQAVGNDAAAVRACGQDAEVIMLAIPYSAVDETVRELGPTVDGKVVIDVTNALTPKMEFALGFTTSAAEELQKKITQARVVKAFNTVFAKHMDNGHVDGEELSCFVASDDSKAKMIVSKLARDIGFDPIDAGPLSNARWLETLGYLNIQLGLRVKLGTDIGFKLVHPQPVP
jgi:predicted dinucleotide-binding enzyme